MISLPVPGDRIDSFELEESIGVGGMGAVFRALDGRLDRQTALKILPPEQAGDPEVVQRFYQEGRAAARLDHENIARVYTIGYDGRYHFIAFEYIEGTTLRQRVEAAGPVPVEDAINFTLQIADALVHASARSVVHRDIKPSNIIITPQGRAKLVDMGLARRFERGGDDGLTQTGMTLGTFDYISPEQARDPRDVDVRSDLYSLGCTLFHMLTGRPPFPGGTVIQKLIQHQEDAPPDVRGLNPAVPPDLAAVLVRLMAKDRDRRYQTPELLVRDLLTTAGALGIRSSSPEGLVWSNPAPPPAWWERHLVWGVPSLLFGLVVLALVYAGEGPVAGPLAAGDPIGLGVSVRPPGAGTKAGGAGPDGGPGAAPRIVAAPTPDARAPTVSESGVPATFNAPPREVIVESTENLLAAVASARPGDTLILSDDGPFVVNPEGPRPDAPRRVPGDLTIKAAQGVRPVIRPSQRPGIGGNSRDALLAFSSGRVTLEGLEFVSDSDEFSPPPSVILAEGTELTVRGCVFRRPAGVTDPGDFPESPGNAAVIVRPGPTPLPAGERPPAVLIERSHFDGGQAGVLASGRADVTLRDCTFASCEPAVRFDNARSATPVLADLTLKHVTVVAGTGPVFRFDGTSARVRADDSIFAATSDGEATLVATDVIESFSWRGRANLFGRVGTYLRTTGGRAYGTFVTLTSPGAWSEGRDEVRESGSVFLDTAAVWAEGSPLRLLATEPENPTRAFRLAESHAGLDAVGTRRGPFGDLSPPPRLAAAGPGPRTVPANPGPLFSTAATARTPTEKRPTPTPAPASGVDKPTQVAQGDPSPSRPDPLPSQVPMPMPVADELPEMPVMPPPSPRAAPAPFVEPDEPRAEPRPAPEGRRPPSRPADPTVLRNVAAFVAALRDAEGRGGVLRIAANADWELPALVARTDGTLRIEAEAGPTRPRLRFRPPVPDAMSSPRWFILFDVQGGTLQIEGVDLVLPEALAPRDARWAAFSVSPATELRLTSCTVTVEGYEPDSAVVIAGASPNDPEPGANAPDPAGATVHLVDSLVRAGGDLLDVSAGRRVTLDARNAVVSTGGSLVHAHGLPRGQSVERVSVNLRHVSARVAGGVLLLESAPMEPELPQAEVKAADSIFATDRLDAPLLRVDGQDGLDAVRDKIVWDGQGNGYHQINTYRRDQSAQLGTMPTLFNRPSWTVAVGDREADPVHGDLRFKRPWGPNRDAWELRPEDVRLANDSPAHPDAGATLDRVPAPPSL